MKSGFSQAAEFILSEAKDDELDFLADHIRARKKMLVQQRVGSLSEGDPVTIENISPRYMEGLTGVIYYCGVGRRKNQVAIKLDKDSTAKLRVFTAGSPKIFILPDVEEHILYGIPMACIRPR